MLLRVIDRRDLETRATHGGVRLCRNEDDDAKYEYVGSTERTLKTHKFMPEARSQPDGDQTLWQRLVEVGVVESAVMRHR